MSENRRTSTRHPVDLPATIVAGESSIDTPMVNLSLGGALMTCHDDQIRMGQKVLVTFHIPTHSAAIEVGATVRWVSGATVGVQFDGMRAREVWSLNKFFESLPA